MADHKRLVMLISREDETVRAVEEPFQGPGVEFVEVRDPARAAQEAKVADPDLIVLDDEVGPGRWSDVYSQLIDELSSFVPILVLVDAERVSEALDEMESGLVDLLVKPIRGPLLRARFNAMLRVKEIHDQLSEERSELQEKLDQERRLREQLAEINEELKKLSTTDSLTDLANRRYLMNWLSTEFEISSRYGMPISAIMIDLDNFKNVNDRHGHPFGDFVLKSIADIIRDESRRADFTARYGGEEFLVVLPNTDGPAAANLAHRIHLAISKRTFREEDEEARVTASVGISSFPGDGVQSPDDLIELADRALYAAKSRGRDMVLSWSEIAPEQKG